MHHTNHDDHVVNDTPAETLEIDQLDQPHAETSQRPFIQTKRRKKAASRHVCVFCSRFRES